MVITVGLGYAALTSNTTASERPINTNTTGQTDVVLRCKYTGTANVLSNLTTVRASF